MPGVNVTAVPVSPLACGTRIEGGEGSASCPQTHLRPSDWRELTRG